MDSGGGEGGSSFDVLSKMQDLRHYLVGKWEDPFSSFLKIVGQVLLACERGATSHVFKWSPHLV